MAEFGTTLGAWKRRAEKYGVSDGNRARAVIDFDHHVRRWLDDPRTWPAFLAPRPDLAGCHVPNDVLTRYGVGRLQVASA
jgi:hypothetical protein